MARNFTREIRKAHRIGVNRVVCSMAPYEGRKVEYSPRSGNDPQPWVLADDPADFRFTGRECHILTFRYAVVESRNRFYVLDTKDGGPQFAGASGVLAVGTAYTSRYAATDAAKRLEKDGALAFAQQENIRRAAETVIGTDDMRQVVKSLRRKA